MAAPGSAGGAASGNASIWANVSAPTNLGVITSAGQFICVAQRAMADLDEAAVKLMGFTRAFMIVHAGASAVVVGQPLATDTSKNFRATSPAGRQFYGMSAVAQAAPTTRTLSNVWFNGIGMLGFGISPG